MYDKVFCVCVSYIPSIYALCNLAVIHTPFCSLHSLSSFYLRVSSLSRFLSAVIHTSFLLLCRIFFRFTLTSLYCAIAFFRTFFLCRLRLLLLCRSSFRSFALRRSAASSSLLFFLSCALFCAFSHFATFVPLSKIGKKRGNFFLLPATPLRTEHPPKRYSGNFGGQTG